VRKGRELRVSPQQRPSGAFRKVAIRVCVPRHGETPDVVAFCATARVVTVVATRQTNPPAAGVRGQIAGAVVWHGRCTALTAGAHLQIRNTGGTIMDKILATVATATLLIGVAATAAEQPTFSDMDKNKDGYLSREEANAAPDLMKLFAAVDADHDNRLTPTEYANALKQIKS
jgi:hypothetical protein